jgi:hypothetical protein
MLFFLRLPTAIPNDNKGCGHNTRTFQGTLSQINHLPLVNEIRVEMPANLWRLRDIKVSEYVEI